MTYQRNDTPEPLASTEPVKPILKETVRNDLYEGATADGKRITMGREHEGTSPNGNRFAGRWVLRIEGAYIDYDLNRFDLAQRHKLKLGTP